MDAIVEIEPNAHLIMWKLKDEKTTPSIKWKIMSIIHGTPKGDVCKLCLTGNFWLLKHFNDEYLLNKK